MYTITMTLPSGAVYCWNPNERWIEAKPQLWTEGEMAREMQRVIALIHTMSSGTVIHVVNARKMALRFKIEINRD